MAETKENKVPVNVRVSPEVEEELRRISLDAKKHDRKATKDAEVESALRVHLNLEHKRPCPVCKSTTYAGAIPSDFSAISKSVPKTEQRLRNDEERHNIEPLPPEAVEIAKAWLVARQVEDEEWRGMLESVTGQLELVANAARKEARKKESAWRGR